MRVMGIGTDIVAVHRIEASLARHGEGFARRILHPDEWQGFRHSSTPAAFLAKRFAAKEAVAKALGVGIGARMSLQDACVDHEPSGRPVLRLDGRAQETAQALGVRETQISLSDEREYALAFVVMSG
ncbi:MULTISPECIES: holo-ACP synthase [Ectothiorhodospira]|uniref:Holo-[acyl-carrier-protein] synthase n=1 Tax=Ectothiorhodospira marina TaxID=1396821 RepID=A0A1H7KLW2_9GAMM|nr:MULTISPECIES: holo-ACP synthase [Ectothiorhodospira]MCG5515255.1 holo-ACP synthase [Ectothiorhodospira sp. 9100]MCG5517896.1 holo-ACP synthase [Ectothiorhodospira sp. 9905]SEK87738.1 holo-[acyl-carrier protein] synthase [Ectothiorhodospira marina]